MLGIFILSVVFNEKMQRTLNALYAEDPLLSKRLSHVFIMYMNVTLAICMMYRFEFIHKMLKRKTVKHSSKVC